MINVDISNIWGEVALPDLLAIEGEVAAAHESLIERTCAGGEYLAWLDLTNQESNPEVFRILLAAERIRSDSDVCVVVGIGGGCLGARAAIELLQGVNRGFGKGNPQILFAGNNFSTRHWKELQGLLKDRDFSVIVVSKSGTTLEPAIALRSLRWMLERKYGTDAANKRIYAVTDPADSALYKMAEEAQWERFSIPSGVTEAYSVLTAAGLLPMAVAGIDPLSVLEGAVEGYKNMDVRSFDNPAWLYAAARYILPQKGRNRELLCVTDHNMESFGRWWNGYVRRHEGGRLSVEAALLPGDLAALDEMVCSSNVFETVVHFEPSSKKFPVEMDWKDYDGLGFLSGRNLDFVEEQLRCAAAETHYLAGVPVLDLYAGELSAVTLGELLYFFELSSALTAMARGEAPFTLRQSASTAAALRAMGAPEVVEDDEA